MENESRNSSKDWRYKRPYNTSQYIVKITKKLKNMQQLSLKKGDKEYFQQKVEICKLCIEYLNHFDENLLLNENNVFFILQEAEEKKKYWDQQNTEDSEKLQNQMKEFFLSLLKKQISSSEIDSDEEEFVCSNKRLNKLKYSLMYGTLGLGLFTYSKTVNVKQHLNKLQQKLEQDQPIHIFSNEDYLQYPWIPNRKILSSNKDWEMRKIQINGILLKSYFLVGRERRGEKGYLVFGGLLTGVNDLHQSIDEDDDYLYQRKKGMIVCLGWIPYNKSKSWVKQSTLSENIYTVQEEDIPDGKSYLDKNTGFYYTLDEDEELFNHKQVLSYNVLQGFLRRDEQQDRMLGRVIKDEGSVNQIDLKRMVGFFRFQNQGNDVYYLDRAVEDLDNEEQQLPIPNDYKNTMQHLEDYEYDSNYNKMNKLKFLSALGFIGSCFLQIIKI